MSDMSNGSRGSRGPREDSGVLANLPRTRPQRSSPRRAAARRKTTPGAKAAEAAAPVKITTRKAPQRAVAAAPSAKTAQAVAKGPSSNGGKPSATTKPSATSSKRATPKRPVPKTAKAPASKNVSHAAARAKQAPAPAKRGGRAARPLLVRPPETVPRQGFETEGEIGGGSVPPPGATELVAATAEIVSELTKAGLSVGGRLMRDVLSRLPLS